MAEQECHEEVSRHGEVQPCNKVAVAMRIDPTFGDPYPVCAFHARGANMMSLSAVEAAVRAEMQREVQTACAIAYDEGYAQAEADHYGTGFWDVKLRRNPHAVNPSTPNQQGAEQK